MKLYCLSGHANRPCFVLKFKQTTIMLDCGLDVTTLMSFLPLPLTAGNKFSKLPGWSPRDLPSGIRLDAELKEINGKVFVDSEPEFAIPELTVVDLAEVDVILLTNYHCMLALPFITEYTGFKGVVYATDPTMHIGRMYMEELVEMIERCPRPGRAARWKRPNVLGYLPPPLNEARSPSAWRQCYNRHDVSASLSKVQTVGYNEKFDIFGALVVTGISSGFCIGSCNWIIQSDYEKIAYVSGSSTLTTHPKPMEQVPLRNCDILIMCALTQTPSANPDAMIGEFCVNAAVTLRNGGNVLVPCYPSGVTYDLFECLSSHLDSCGLSSVPMYFISPVADSSLAYSNIYAEWLSGGKQSKVYLPEPPFPHAELVKNNRLRHFPSLHDGFTKEMRTPCIVFTGHPSLRFGDSVHFIELWGKSSGNTIIFTEPDFPYLDALAPYQPLNCKVCYCPIDTSLSFAQANKLIRDLKPSHLVAAEQYTVPPLSQPLNTDLIIDCDTNAVTYRKNQVLTLPIRRMYERIELDPQLAAGLMPTEIRAGVAIASVTGQLVAKDSKHILQPLPRGANFGDKYNMNGSDVSVPVNVWGTLEVPELLENLTKQGITDVKVEDGPGGGHIIHLPSDDVLIQLEEGSTHIICEGNEAIRIKLRDILLKCLAKF